MGKFTAIADTCVRYDKPDSIAGRGEPLEIGFGRRMAYMEFHGFVGEEEIQRAKLRLYAEKVPFHARVDIYAVPEIEIGAGISWNDASDREGAYIDTVDFYRDREGWYEADVSRALAGVTGEFHITFRAEAQTYPGREVIRLKSGDGGGGKYSPLLVTEECRRQRGREGCPEPDSPEDGYEMYLRYRPGDAQYCRDNLSRMRKIFLNTSRDKALRYELTEALTRIAGFEPEWYGPETEAGAEGQFGLRIIETQKKREDGSYRILEKEGLITIEGEGAGALYGTFILISHIQRGRCLKGLYLEETPYFKRRMLSHWDNFDGSIERGYAGRSFWKWNHPDAAAFRRYRDYGRLCAAVGINGLVVNNVNPNPEFISDKTIPLLARMADCFREYGIRLYTSVSFDTPILQGGLDTADPEAEEVKAFWKRKTELIYRLIPDFGGFCVKGDSEGQPGPLKYGRSHACGANMLADVLAPYGGIVLWRAFVYHVPGLSADRACHAYEVFSPLDGKFRDNVILQIKNGPLDFQVNEPLSPLFGAMRHTKLGLEVQTALEYKGQTTHLCFVPEEFKRVLTEETGNGAAAAVCREAFQAVINTGNDKNWTRYTMAQANFFGTGRLAFNPFLSLEEIQEEWAQLTFSTEEAVVKTCTELLRDSYSIYAAYAAPYGLGFLCDRDTHFHPEPESRGSFHGCDKTGLGYDRTITGSGFCAQYVGEQQRKREDLKQAEEKQLLWYHHLPFDYRIRDGRTLIQALYDSLFEGAEKTLEMTERFRKIKGLIDEKRYQEIKDTLCRQRTESVLNLALAGGYGVKLNLVKGEKRYLCEKRNGISELQVFAVSEDGFLFRVQTG